MLKQGRDIAAGISRKIESAFSPTTYKLINDSDKHLLRQQKDAFDGARQTHFTLLIVSDAFADTSLVYRHRLVYTTLAAELSNGVHALSLRLYTPEEWRQMKASAQENIASPPCISRKI